MVGVLVAAWSLQSSALAQAVVLAPEQRARYQSLQARKLHELAEHRELAEYLRLRSMIQAGKTVNVGEEVAYWAFKSLGQPYQRKTRSFNLEQADCVTFTERCIALGCTDNWLAAYKLQNRLRYRDGSGNEADRNREPILDWVPANSWLMAEVTTELGVPLKEFDVYYEGRQQRTAYIAKEELPQAYDQLLTGDILLVIGETPNPPSDPVVRTRCVHMAIVYREGQQVDILHSYPPAASRWPLDRLLRNPYIRGVKVLRLKAQARALAAAEVQRLSGRFEMTPNQLDNQLLLSKGRPGWVTASRPPEATEVIDGIEYGIIHIRPGETLWSLFKSGYKGVCALPINKAFVSRHPDLKNYEGERVYFPIRRAGDTSPDPAPLTQMPGKQE
ncbi:MAG TPA: hypothetical protein PK184_09815 [Phycisphaerae bacterium]|nr:hypothetical protein [Phycisphaerae bacterium]HOJ56830.1 hypothetical protein [Phycisphaerae bacterium]HOL28224.1 hypothetical protein [Phycisphaerae bacterium]HPU32983.1 hypothetical protein [Phycisphaerae bacterium]HQE45251.1 hypothetical protein [Phycisphaerae bacterium]